MHISAKVVYLNGRKKNVEFKIKKTNIRCGRSTKEAYQKLLDAGYSMREAKEKIGVVVLTEIYDVMKENQSYDEKRYTNALAEMIQHSIDFEDTHKIITECQ